jgi:replicative DNA helicase
MDATQPAQGQATGKGKILVISLEMPASQILDRLVAKQANVSLRTLAEGVKNEGDFRRVATAISSLARTGLVVRDDLYDLASICATARAMAKSGGLEAIVVDYIQLVRFDLGKDGTREREVAEVSRGLRLLAMELKCVLFAITQLNEAGKARESRAIQQDATAVLVVKVEDEEYREISIPIQRNGPCGVSTSLRFSGKTASFHHD